MRHACRGLSLLVLTTLAVATPPPGLHATQRTTESARRITWQDVAPLHPHLEARGLSAATFAARVDHLAAANARRVRLGDLDHLVFYLLQSRGFTSLPPIEPALSARALVDGLDPAAREAFIDGASSAPPPIDRDVRARVRAFLGAIGAPRGDARLAYFGHLVADEVPAARDRERALLAEYLRVMRFVYEKEFGAGRASTAEAAALYRTRGLSTDTAVEAGFVVSQAIGMLRGLAPERRVRRILIIGAGLDLAPRTALLEAAPPQSYQPWAVLDAIAATGLSTLDDVELVAADINPRVVDHIRSTRTTPPDLLLLSGIGDDERVALSAPYREYFAALGRAIGAADAGDASRGAAPAVPRGHLFKRVQVTRAAAGVVDAVQLDAVTQRLDRGTFDLVVATNVFPYFDDEALALALVNIAAVLAPDGVLLHNEPRARLHEVATALGLPPSHSRHAVIATVRGAAAPLGDSVWLHVRSPGAVR